MGSFRSSASRASQVATLTAAHLPKGVRPEDWLGEGESITYRTQMPHGAAADIADAATTATMTGMGRRAQMRAVYNPGKAAVATFLLGLVNWVLYDETGAQVPFAVPAVGSEGWFEAGKEIMSSLPEAVVTNLQELINSGSEPSLAERPDDADPENPQDTVGNVSGGN